MKKLIVVFMVTLIAKLHVTCTLIEIYQKLSQIMSKSTVSWPAKADPKQTINRALLNCLLYISIQPNRIWLSRSERVGHSWPMLILETAINTSRVRTDALVHVDFLNGQRFFSALNLFYLLKFL